MAFCSQINMAIHNNIFAGNIKSTVGILMVVSGTGPVDKDEKWAGNSYSQPIFLSIYRRKDGTKVDWRYSSAAVRMPRFRILERLYLCFIAAKLPSALIFRFCHAKAFWNAAL